MDCGTPIERVARVRVPEPVRGHPSLDARAHGGDSDNPEDLGGVQPPSLATEEHQSLRVAPTAEVLDLAPGCLGPTFPGDGQLTGLPAWLEV